MINLFMLLALLSYLGAAVSYARAGQCWMGCTMLFYACSIVTIYMAGTR